MRRLCLIVLMCALPACSNDETFDPTGPGGPTIPSIGGTFSSPDMYHFELTGGRNQTLDCGGALTIGTQIATTFTGSFVISDQRCTGGGSVGGSVTSGTFSTADGTVSFGLTGSSTIEPNFLAAAHGCTYVSGDRLLTGTITATTIQAEARTVISCGTNGMVNVFTRVIGSR
jgi:hypothetical protein